MIVQDAESNWQFDIFALAEATPGHTLSLLAVHLHKAAGFMDTVDKAKFWCYARAIENGYLSTNPYHNRCRAHQSRFPSLIWHAVPDLARLQECTLICPDGLCCKCRWQAHTCYTSYPPIVVFNPLQCTN